MLKVLARKKWVKFILTGIVNTLVGYIIFVIALALSSQNIKISLLVNLLVGIVFNFFSYGFVVFNNLSAKQFLKFIISYLFLYVLNVNSISLLNGYEYNVYVAQLICRSRLIDYCRRI